MQMLTSQLKLLQAWPKLEILRMHVQIDSSIRVLVEKSTKWSGPIDGGGRQVQFDILVYDAA